MLTLQSQLREQQFQLENMNGSVEKAVNNAVTSLTSDLQCRMQKWKGQVVTQIDSRIPHHWEASVKKWEGNVVQLEPGSKDGTIAMAENRLRTNVQKELESCLEGSHGEGRQDHYEQHRNITL